MGSGDEIGVGNREELVRTSMDVESVGGPPAGGGTANLEETTIQQKIPNFEACIRDIDDAINSVPMITHSIDGDLNTHADKIGKNLLTNGNPSLLLNSETESHDLRSDKEEIYVRELSSPKVSFVVGQVDNMQDNNMGLSRPNRNKNKGNVTLKNKNGPSPSKPKPVIRRSPHKGNFLSA